MRAFNDQRHVSLGAEELGANIPEVQRLVRTMEADLGLVIDPGAERLYLVDETGAEVPLEKALLLFVKLVAQQAAKGEKIVLPLTVTHLAETLAGEFGVEVVRTKVSLPALAQAATADGVVFAGSLGGGYIFPRFLPAFDAVMSLGKLLELLAPAGAAAQRAGRRDPRPARSCTRRSPARGRSRARSCARPPRTCSARPQAATREIGLVDGIQLRRDGGWVQLLPDADEPVFHVYAEGADRADSESLAESFLDVVRGVIQEHTE